MVAVLKDRRYSRRPTAVIALADIDFGQALANQLSIAGWEPIVVEDARSARKAAAKHGADVVVISAEGDEESGYLLCAKMTRERHPPRVILITEEWTEGRETYAAFSGASHLIEMSAGTRALAARISMMVPVRV